MKEIVICKTTNIGILVNGHAMARLSSCFSTASRALTLGVLAVMRLARTASNKRPDSKRVIMMSVHASVVRRRAVMLCVVVLVFIPSLGGCALAEFYGDPPDSNELRTGYYLGGDGELVIAVLPCTRNQLLENVRVIDDYTDTDQVFWSAQGTAKISGRTFIEFGEEPIGLDRVALSDIGSSEFVVDLTPLDVYALGGPLRLGELPTESSGQIINARDELVSRVEFWRDARASCGGGG